jgi:transcriptional regulator of aromatic amino acid metabolism
VGIVLYKNRRFSLANQEAHDFIGINLNAQDGHVITKTFKSLARQVAEYRSTITMSCKNKEGKKIILYGTPQLDDNTVIILVSYPEIADIIKSKTELLHDPSAWDYLLYLETTHSGQLINHLIPGGGSQLLQFKLDLLKLALSKNALLLEMPEEDLQPMVEIIHNVSLRERLYTLNLTAPAKMPDIAIKLFGINHVFASTQQEPGLLEQVSKQGTLFIHNVHFLPREVQTRLAEFIKYGHYTIFRSDQKIVSGARLICSSNQNLALLTANGKFCTALFEELRATTLSMPSLLTLSDEELSALAQGLADQAMEDSALKNILELNEKETGKLVHARPVSLQEFKYKVQQALQSKAKKSAAARSHQFDTPVIDEYDPFLADAARMGKRALKDSTVMHKLWSRFRNQNKIAEFLGVNRSSVYRRCKDFGFHELE